jgi:hypothetical protein
MSYSKHVNSLRKPAAVEAKRAVTPCNSRVAWGLPRVEFAISLLRQGGVLAPGFVCLVEHINLAQTECSQISAKTQRPPDRCKIVADPLRLLALRTLRDPHYRRGRTSKAAPQKPPFALVN